MENPSFEIPSTRPVEFLVSVYASNHSHPSQALEAGSNTANSYVEAGQDSAGMQQVR